MSNLRSHLTAQKGGKKRKFCLSDTSDDDDDSDDGSAFTPPNNLNGRINGTGTTDDSYIGDDGSADGADSNIGADDDSNLLDAQLINNNDTSIEGLGNDIAIDGNSMDSNIDNTGDASNSNNRGASSSSGAPPNDTIDEATSNNNNANGSDDDIAEDDDSSSTRTNIKHCLVATLLSVVCTHEACGCVVQQRGSGLWIPHRKLISNHLQDKKKKCYAGNTIPFGSATKIEKKLKADQVGLYEKAKMDTNEAARLIEKHFPSSCKESERHFCSKCGHSSKRKKNFEKHFSDTQNTFDCTKALHSSKGTVITNDYGVSIPQAILKEIEKGTFKLPYMKPPTCDSTTNQQPPTAAAASIASVVQPVQVPAIPPLVTPSRQSLPQSMFSASSREMAKATSSEQSASAINETTGINEAMGCFVDSSQSVSEQKKMLAKARDHLNTFLPLIDHMDNPAALGDTLRNMKKQMEQPYDSTSDPYALRILLSASHTWLNLVANNDVRRLCARYRSMLYHVGSEKANLPSEEILLQGSTFVPSGKMQYIIKECEMILRFLFRSNWPGMQNQLQQIMQIYRAMPTEDLEEVECANGQDATSRAADKIVDTRIVCGILLAAVLEPNHAPTGTNMIGKYLAARSIATSNNSDHLTMKSPNGIAKNTNSLLRLLRHAVCSFLVREAREIRDRNGSSLQFEGVTLGVLHPVQVSSYVILREGHAILCHIALQEINRPGSPIAYLLYIIVYYNARSAPNQSMPYADACAPHVRSINEGYLESTRHLIRLMGKLWLVRYT